jgi:hypothetical protein
MNFRLLFGLFCSIASWRVATAAVAEVKAEAPRSVTNTYFEKS